MINIVIPMAGAGSRFAKAGFKDPKPLIPVKGTPMIKVVIDNLRPSRPHRFIFICQSQHVTEYDLRPRLTEWAPNCEIVQLDGLTEGAACTVLAARGLIDNEDPLMIANSDQYIDHDIDAYLAAMDRDQLDGLIMTMKADDPKWSFVGFDDQGRVNKVVEKEVISDEATVGIYNFAHGSQFVQAADAMLRDNLRVNNEFYVAPTYNTMIQAGARLGVYNIGSEAHGMYGLGIPSDLQLFIDHPVSRDIGAGT